MTNETPSLRDLLKVLGEYAIRGLWHDLGFKLRLRSVRRVQTWSRATLDTLIRARFDLPLVSDDANVDRNVHKAVNAFLKGNCTDRDFSDSSTRFLQWLQSDDECRTILKQYLTTQHWIMEYIYRRAVPADALTYAHAYQSTFDQIVPSSDFRSIRKFGMGLRAAHRKSARSLSESRAARIDVSTLLRKTSTVAWIAFLTPTAIAVYGYLFSSVYFGHFGIDTAMFFSTGDYIAHSINYLNILAFLLAGSAAGALSVVRDATALPAVVRRIQNRRRLRHAYVLSVIISLGSIVRFWDSPHMFFLGLMLLILILALGHRASYAIMDRYFETAPFTGWFVGVLLTCGLVVWCYAKSQAHAVIELPVAPFLVETSGRTFSDANYKIIGASSSSVFLLGDGADVEVVPTRTVRRVIMSKRGDGIVTTLRLWVLEWSRRVLASDEVSRRDGDP